MQLVAAWQAKRGHFPHFEYLLLFVTGVCSASPRPAPSILYYRRHSESRAAPLIRAAQRRR